MEQIGALLDSRLTDARLAELLRAREAELTEQILEDSARLQEVHSRLLALEKESP